MDDMSEVGSIGAIATFTSVSRRLKEDGVDVLVVRSGPDKAPLHPAEPISERGKQDLEEKVGYYHQAFISNVLRMRPQLASVSLDRWATGKTFFYTDALSLSLADRAPVSLGTLIGELVNQQQRPRGLNSYPSGEHLMSKKQIMLTEAARAALASGASPDALGDLPQDPAPKAVAEEASDEVQAPGAAAQADGTPVGDAPVAASASPTKVDEPAPAAAAESNGGLIGYLQAQVAEKEQRIEALLTELNAAKADKTALQGVEAALKPVAIEACHRMQVALGQSPTKLEGLGATAISEFYGGLRQEFNDRFKVGRTSLEADVETRQQRNLMHDRLQMIDGGKN